MTTKLKRLVAALGLALVLTAAQAADVVFINLADIHSAYDALPRVLTKVQQLVRSNEGTPTYVLIDGDLFEPGNIVAARSEGAVDWAFLTALDEITPVIVNIGNHEFDFVDTEEFARRAREAGLTVIGNVIDAGGDLVAPAVTTLSVGNRTLDLVGLATNARNTYGADARAGLILAQPQAWATYVGPLTVLSDYVIVLSHAGVVADRQLMPALPDNTLFVVGAHDHLTLENHLQRPDGRPLLYVHNGAKAETLGIVEVTFAAEPEVDFHREPIDTSIAPNPSLEGLVAQTRDRYLQAQDLSIIGTVHEDMGLVEAAQWAVTTLKDATGADVAFLNHTSFGAGLAAGPLPKYRFDAFLRFDNDVMTAQVDGRTLAAILALANQGPDTSLEARTGDFVYATPITPDPDKTYKLVTSSWVALPSNVTGYLGTDGLVFTKLENVTVKGILSDALGR